MPAADECVRYRRSEEEGACLENPSTQLQLFLFQPFQAVLQLALR